MTFSIKVSFCSAQGGGTRVRSRAEGEEDLEPGGSRSDRKEWRTRDEKDKDGKQGERGETHRGGTK